MMSTEAKEVEEPPTKQQRLEHVEAIADRLSDLPDSVLTRILSFLPTEDSVQTNLLSNRWRGLWTKVPCLLLSFHNWRNFLCKRHSLASPFSNDTTALRFEQFIFRVLLKYTAGGSTIRNFSLHCGHVRGNIYNVPSHINSWIAAAVLLNVEELDVTYQTDFVNLQKNILPPSFFTCKTVKNLTFDYVTFREVPSRMHLPLLQKLTLRRALFQNFQKFHNFLMGCPNIHSLALCNAVWRKPSHENTSYEMLHFSHLTQVTLEVSDGCLSGNYGHCVTYYGDLLLYAFPNVEKLSMKMVPWIWRGGASSIGLSKFQDLRQLHVDTVNPTVLTMLSHFDKLEGLVITQGIGHDQAIWNAPECVPNCITSSLTTFCFRGCECKVLDFEFVRYIMENAKVLLKMEVYSRSYLQLKLKHDILKKLFTFKRASQACQAYFE